MGGADLFAGHALLSELGQGLWAAWMITGSLKAGYASAGVAPSGIGWRGGG